MSRRPEHFEHQGPNEPEPETFLRKSPPVFWWVMGALTVLTVIGLAAAWTTQRAIDEPESDSPEVAGAQEQSHEVSFTGDGFDPGNIDVPRNQELVVVNDSDSDCQLSIEGNQGHAVGEGEVGSAPPGGEVTWVAEEPGQYAVRCEGSEQLLRVTVP